MRLETLVNLPDLEASGGAARRGAASLRSRRLQPYHDARLLSLRRFRGFGDILPRDGDRSRYGDCLGSLPARQAQTHQQESSSQNRIPAPSPMWPALDKGSQNLDV